MDTPRSSSEPNSSAEPADLSGVTISGQANVTARDIIGRDKIVHGDEYIGYSAAQVTVLLDKIRTEYQSKPFDGRSPYIGLASFQERDADKFFGRETLTAELVTRVATCSSSQNARAVFVAGPSGSGKSSLVRAGLIPALRRGAPLWSPNSGSEHWLYETIKPGREPLVELKRVVGAFAQSPNAGNEFLAHALTDPTSLHEWVNISLRDEATRRAVILIDQFEEIFTQLNADQEAKRAAFLNLLTYAATVENGRTLVVFTLRSDFVSNCASYPTLNALVNQQFIQVGAMTPDELVSAIARPALQVGLRLDPALIAQIVNDVRGEPGALPLMQFALQDLFEAEKAKGELTLDGYLARGGLHQALERHADAEFAKLDDAEKQLARTVFSGLVEIGRGREDTKRTANFADLVPAGADETKVQALVRALADARLITTDEQDGKETVTLAHERLIDAWDWLRRLVGDNRDAIALQNEIAQDAGEWVQHKRDESYLYRGARLATAQEKLQQNKLVLNGLAQEYVETAIAARERNSKLEQQRTRRLIIAFGAAAVVFGLLAVLAFFLQQRAVDSEHQAQAASTRALEQQGTAEAERANAEQAQADAEAAADAADTAARESGRQKILADNARATAEAEARRAEQQAIISQSKSLAAQSGFLRQENLDASLLLGVEALKLSENYEARNSLFTSLETTHLLTTLHEHTGPVWGVAFSPDGTTLASGSEDNTIRLWDVRDPTHPQALGEPLTGHTGWVISVAFSPDGKTLVSGGQDNTIRLWDVRDPAHPRALGEPLTGHTDWVWSVAFSRDGATLASGSCGERDTNEDCKSGEIRLWNVRDPVHPQALGEPLTGHTGSVNSVAFSPDGTTLASGSYDSTIRLWDVRDPVHPQALDEPLTGHTGPVNSVAFSSDGATLASGSDDNTIRLWDVRDPAHPRALGEPLTGHTHWVISVAFSRDGATLASGSADKTVRLWNVRDPAHPQALGEPLTGHTSPVYSVAFSPDGAMLASGSEDNTIRLWDLRDPAHPRTLGEPLTGHTGWVFSVAFSPDGTTLASGSDDNTIRLWDLRDPAHPRALGEPLTGHTSPVSSVAFSPDGTTLASGSCGERDTNEDCKSGEIRLWNVRDPADPQALGEPLTGHTGWVRSVAFSRDGTALASGSWDNTIRLWDVSDPAGPQALGEPLTGHTSPVLSVAFSRDGTTLASGSSDGTIRLWDVRDPADPRALGEPLTGHMGSVSSVAFSPDGAMLASGSGDKTVRLWDVDLSKDALAVRACAVVNRNLTRTEYAKYIDIDSAAYDSKYAEPKENRTCPDLPVEPLAMPTPTP